MTSLGATLRELRKRRGYTLDVVAAGSGLSRSALSDLERDRRSIDAATLARVALALGCRIAAITGEPVDDSLVLERAAWRTAVVDARTGVERRRYALPLLAEGAELNEYVLPARCAMRRGLRAVWYLSAAGRPSGPFPSTVVACVEHLTVLEGTLAARRDRRNERLGPGDSVHYRLEREVELLNEGDGPARVLIAAWPDVKR